MSVDCAIFTVSLGFSAPDPFSAFVPRWYAALASMDPPPAEVCIACPFDDVTGVDVPPVGFSIPVRIVRVASRHMTDFLSAAVNHASTKWVSWCGLDDVVTSDALADLKQADADGYELVAGNYVADGRIVGGWDVHAMARGGLNNTAANSPFTKSAFARAGGWPDVHFHDWGLWLRLAAAGVRVKTTNRVGMVQDLGHTHVTRSGVQMPSDLRQQAMREIAGIVAELGL